MKRIFFIILVLTFFYTEAQENTSKEPKVGLVLSGGGAKGFAHIGALKIIDSLGIRVDYIAGTSMGAIIGGLYASGYSGKQLDSIFNNVDFDQLINDILPRDSKSSYERENNERHAITLPFDNFKLKLPSAISRGQNVFNLLSKLTLHVSDIAYFENLPIPFFCIATNVETGKAVILDKGSLPQAMSASGAFPSLFKPKIIDNQLLIDGGVVNNYPIDELKAKGVDIIIGVDVQDDLLSREEIESAPDILLQINNYRTIKDMSVKSKQTDIYIKPDIKEFNVVSFDEGKKIIESGKVATQKMIVELQRLASQQNTKKSVEVKVSDPDSIAIKWIKLKGNKKYTRSYILGKLKIRANEKVSYADFSKGVNNLVATNNFDSFSYTFEPNAEGYDFNATLKENKNTTFFKLGIHYDDLYKSAALVNLTKKRVLVNNDVASLDVILGDNVRYNFDYYIDKGFYWSVGLKSRFNRFEKNVNATLLLSDDEIQQFGVNKLDIELEDFTNQFYLQTLFRNDFSLKLGLEHKRLNISSETILNNIDDEEIYFEKSDFFSVFGQLKLDTYDSKYFPKRGVYFDGQFQLFLSSSDFNNNFSQFSFAKAKMGYAIPFSSKFSAVIGSQGGFKIGEDSNNSLNFALGGYGNDFINNFVPFFGYDFISLSGNGYVKGSIDLDYEWLKKHHITMSANFANVGDEIYENGSWFSAPDYSGYALGYSVETFLGPLEGKVSYSPETKKSIWFF